jgi:integrase
MQGKLIKLFRCPEPKCTLNRRVEAVPKKVPRCPICNSTRAYYSDNWYISYTRTGRKPVLEVSSPFKDIATKRLAEILEEVEEGVHQPFKKGLTWLEASKLVLDYKKATCKREGTYRYYKEKLAVLDTYMGQFVKTMDDINNDTLVAIGNFRKTHPSRTGLISPNTINKEIAVIEHCRALLSDGHILREVDGKKISWLKPRNLSAPIEKLEEILPPEVIWEPDEIEKLLGATDDTFAQAYILLACLGGLRKRTCQEFRREWINWNQNRLEIPPEGRKRGKGKFHYVSMPDALQIALKKVWVGYRPYNYEESKFYKEHADTYYSNVPCPTPFEVGYLFCKPDDAESMWSGFQSIWYRLKEKVGIQKRFHDLKHTAGTLFQWATKDFKATMDFLDESTLAMTARYIRSSNDIREENMKKFQALFQQKMVEKELPLKALPAPSKTIRRSRKAVVA